MRYLVERISEHKVKECVYNGHSEKRAIDTFKDQLERVPTMTTVVLTSLGEEYPPNPSDFGFNYYTGSVDE